MHFILSVLSECFRKVDINLSFIITGRFICRSEASEDCGCGIMRSVYDNVLKHISSCHMLLFYVYFM